MIPRVRTAGSKVEHMQYAVAIIFYVITPCLSEELMYEGSKA